MWLSKAMADERNSMNRIKEMPNGWIYLGDEKERYILGQRGFRNMLVFGANPSTASPGDENLDPTIRKVRMLCERAGYDGWIMANLYPLRSTNPKDLPGEADEKLRRISFGHVANECAHCLCIPADR